MPQPARPRVLIVDDTSANRQAFEAVLGEEYSVTLAESGARALELGRREAFDVILLDVRMPQMDGFETAALLRKHWATRHTPIIFTSAYDQHLAQIKKGFVAGATDYLFSPVDPELLKFKVSTYVEMHLRYEAAAARVRHLRKLLQSLLYEAERPGSPEKLLEDKIRELEEVLDDLQREISPKAT